MNVFQPLRKSARYVTIAAVIAVSTAGMSGIAVQADAAAAAAVSKSEDATAKALALKTLNSFYKPALKGQFPGSVEGLTVGVSTRKDVIEKIGEPEEPAKNAGGFDVYHAEMGHPGYAIAYNKSGRISEIRYFGTNVERQTNIGGITLSMLKKHWGAPNATTTIKNGKLVQKKVVYNRGDYVLSFIFNKDNDLDHINLTKKPVKK
ncbi:YjgB family protein [Paenibacillus sp. GCM10027626]|uniref:YjgB family protein n=1 Tax=Paenibacillus sp. GCM10027626 TaxID=3273411 RepID=UPI003638F33C